MDIDVSFPKDVFTKDDFDVDRFLQESCQKSGLHKLHKELGVYIKYLQAMIVDLVNNESTAIVHLSSELKVLQNKFEDISRPLGQLHEEFLVRSGWFVYIFFFFIHPIRSSNCSKRSKRI